MNPSHLYHSIHHGIARALFVSAWIDYQEDLDTGAISGGDLWQGLLPTAVDPAAERAATDIIASLEALHGEQGITSLYQEHVSSLTSPFMFGQLIGVQSTTSETPLLDMGLGLAVPSYDFGWLDLDDDYFPALDHEISDEDGDSCHERASPPLFHLPISTALTSGA